MNENINLCEILKDCPKGTKLYSPIFGEVEFLEINNNNGSYPIFVMAEKRIPISFTATGKFYHNHDESECLLFPSKDQRDWSKFYAPWLKKPKFDPKTLQPFDRVLVRDDKAFNWMCSFFSYICNDEGKFKYHAIMCRFVYCIPYNEETKHLVGTSDEAPEYYRYWED